MKSPISKSLIFSFFLLGIIAGMVAIEFGYITPPSLDSLQPEWSKANGRATPQPESATAVNASKRSVKERRTESETAAQPTPAPLIIEPIRCDRDEAMAVRESARKIAIVAEQGEQLSVTLNREWAYYTRGIRRSFIERFAASDTCLNGRARIIHFYFRGERVATADSLGTIAIY